MIIFDKFGDGQSERNRSGMNEQLSRPALVSPSAMSTHGWIADSLRGIRVAGHGPRWPLSNRELNLLERHLSHCRQKKATVSNRELSTIRNFAATSALARDRVAVLPRGPRIAGRGSRPLAPFLTGSASQTEFDVTPTKQKVEKFLTGARTTFKVAQFRPEFQPKSQPQREPDCRSRDAAEQGKIPLHTPTEKELS
ncbi:MAG: hypothetical protein ABSB66_16760 [Candidatus Acidiferrales bacterium]|jgi:hypothetical protein